MIEFIKTIGFVLYCLFWAFILLVFIIPSRLVIFYFYDDEVKL